MQHTNRVDYTRRSWLTHRHLHRGCTLDPCARAEVLEAAYVAAMADEVRADTAGIEGSPLPDDINGFPLPVELFDQDDAGWPFDACPVGCNQRTCTHGPTPLLLDSDGNRI